MNEETHTGSARNSDTEQTPSSAQAAPANPDGSPAAAKSGDPVRRFTFIVLAVAGLLFVWYVLADRYAPWTNQARIEGFVVPVTPRVSGKVVKVNVVQDKVVQAGDLLVEIDPREYTLSVQRAESDLEIAGQETGADTAAVKAAEAVLAEARAGLLKAQQDVKRYANIHRQDPGAVSAAARDRAEAQRAAAQAQIANATAELEKAKEQLGKGGEDNPRVRDAVATLQQTRIDLADTKLYAPSFGVITNLNIDEGHYAAEGTPLMTFVSANDVWVKAYLRENSLEYLQAGNPVEILLDVLPGRIFQGEVSSIGFAVRPPSGGNAGELEQVKDNSGWVRDAQRFPVIIRFSGDESTGFRRHGAQADVQIYTGDNSVVNALGWLWIRLMSILSYVY